MGSCIDKKGSDKLIVGLTNGIFDLLHVGHIRLLKECSKLCDILIVCVNSDLSTKRLKGNSRPIIPQEYRIELINAIRWVDYVYMFEEDTPIKLIEQLKPDIIMKGGDYKKEDVVGSHLAEIVIIPLVEEISTSNIVDKIYERKNI